MDSLLFLLFTIIYLVILIIILKILKKSSILSLFFLLPVVIGLLYDNGVITLGKFLGEGTLAENLNLLRFLLHALFTPFLVFYAWAAIKKTNSRFAQSVSFQIAPFIVTPLLILIELYTEVVGLRIVPKWEYGVLSYSSEHSGGPPIMVILVSIILLIAAIIVLIKQKWIWFFVGAFLMIVMSAVRIPINSNAVTNLFEVVLVVSLLSTSLFQARNPVK
ncbi:hypothetical protein [Niallia sp. Man26]|uniref:hypothetical protein n=1 Tax=Niallia sp. Man26 TaxID=2912824 RepID=UPI001EDA6B21|nr:hypothetical protein [Niallia sp. Man26]UPO90322.1 hypothetical protein L8T27_019820 [Niallia sp. Man26]